MQKWLFIFTISLLLFSCTDNIEELQQKSFMKFYGDSYSDDGAAIIQLADEGYVIVGSISEGDEHSDIFVVKTDPFGNTSWKLTLGDSLNDNGIDVILDHNENILVGGTTTNPQTENTDIFIAQLNQTGQVNWQKTFKSTNNQTVKALHEGADGTYLIVGTTDAPSTQNPQGVLDGYVLNVTKTGDSLWAKAYGSSSADQINDICESHNGGYVLVGSTKGWAEPGLAESNMLFIELTAFGGLVDSYTVGGTNNDYGNGVIKTDNGYYFVGTTNSNAAGKSDVFLIHTGTSFRNIILSKKWGREGTDQGNSFLVNSSGSITIAGSTDSYGEGSSDMYIMNISNKGKLINEYTYGSNAVEKARKIIETSDGGYAMIGVSVFSENSMIVVIKTDANYNL